MRIVCINFLILNKCFNCSRQTNEVTGTRQQAQNLNDDLVDKENKTNEAIIAKNTQPTTPEVVMSEQIVGSQGNKENEKNSGSDVEAV